MSEDEKKAIDMLEKFITEHEFYNIKQSDGLENNIKILLDLYKQEKEWNQKIIKAEKFYRELYNDVVKKTNERYIPKDKIRELLKVIQKEKDIATKNILEKDYNIAENGAICQELGYIEGKLKELLED